MTKLDRRQCSCGERRVYVCDWPTPGKPNAVCGKPICEKCVRKMNGRDCCPFHRGDLPKTPEEIAAEHDDVVKAAQKAFRVKR